jgi:hypothetical protein
MREIVGAGEFADENGLSVQDRRKARSGNQELMKFKATAAATSSAMANQP